MAAESKLHDELRQQLLELVYDLLPDDEAADLRQRIAADPEIAEAYAKAERMAELFAASARAPAPPIDLAQSSDSAVTPPPVGLDAVAEVSGKAALSAKVAPTQHKRSRPAGGTYKGNGRASGKSRWWAVPKALRTSANRQSLDRALRYAFAIAAGLLVAITIGGYFYQTWRRSGLEAKYVRLTIAGPKTLEAGVDNVFSVTAHTVSGQPLACPLSYAVGREFGDDLAPKTKLVTDSSGRATFVVHPKESGIDLAKIELVAEGQAVDSRLLTNVAIQSGSYVTHLSLDKPLYQPGEIIRYRALTVGRFGLNPLDRCQVDFEIRDPSGAVLSTATRHVAGERGVAAEWFALPPDAPGGKYKLGASSPAGVFPTEERSFYVRRYELARLKKDLELTRDSYRPGESVEAKLTVQRAEGGPAIGARLTVIASVDGKESSRYETVLDHSGAAQLKIKLPESMERGDAQLAAAIDDGGVKETVAKTIRVNLGRIDVELFPESGDLVPGVENRVYFSARDPLSKPADLKGHVIDGAGREIAPLVTTYKGMGLVKFTPQVGESYSVRLDGPGRVVQQPASLEASAAHKFALSTGKGVFEAKQPLELTIHSRSADAPLLVAAYCRGVLVGQQAITAHEGANPVSVALPAAVGGVVRVTVFDLSGVSGQSQPRAIAERLVYRRESQKLNVQVAEHKRRYSPGEHVELSLAVTNEKGKPTPAILGVSVAADSLSKMLDDELPSLPTHLFLTSEVEKAEDLEKADFYLSNEPKAAEALDLLLGVQGWRRFADRMIVQNEPGAGAAKDGNAKAELSRLSTLGEVSAPMVADNNERVTAAWQAALKSSARDKEQQLAQLGHAALLFGFPLVLAAAFVLGLGLCEGGRYWTPVLGATACCLAIAWIWIQAPNDISDDGGRQVAQNKTDSTQPEVYQFTDSDIGAGDTVKPMAEPGLVTDDSARWTQLSQAPAMSAEHWYDFNSNDATRYGQRASVGMQAPSITYGAPGASAGPQGSGAPGASLAANVRVGGGASTMYPSLTLGGTSNSNSTLTLSGADTSLSSVTITGGTGSIAPNPNTPPVTINAGTLSSTGGQPGPPQVTLDFRFDPRESNFSGTPTLPSSSYSGGINVGATVKNGSGTLRVINGNLALDQGQVLPHAYYVHDDPRYFPAGPEFKLNRDAATHLKESQGREGQAPTKRAQSVWPYLAAIDASQQPATEWLTRGDYEIIQVREYAHRHVASDSGERQDFSELVYWNPLLVTDAEGRATLAFDLSDLDARLRVQIDAHADTQEAGEGRIGTGDSDVVCRLPLSVEPRLPLELTAGDRLDLPVAVVNETEEKLPVDVTLAAKTYLAGVAAKNEPAKDDRSPQPAAEPDSGAIIEPARPATEAMPNSTPNRPAVDVAPPQKTRLELPAGGRGRAHFALEAAQPGLMNLEIRGAGASATDAKRRQLAIAPAGYPVSAAYSGVLRGDVALTVRVPADALPGTVHATLQALPSPKAELVTGLESMLGEPHGCFEQTSSTNYPNILILQYLKENNLADPQLVQRAASYLDVGYRRLTSYECPGGGFSQFGQNPASLWLTAYGLMEFHDMAAVYPGVDQAMVKRTAEWLHKQRGASGGFVESSANNGQGSSDVAVDNPYILWALSEVGQEKIDAEVDGVIAGAQKTSDPYVLALTALIASNVNRTAPRDQVLARLAKLQKDDGHFDAATSVTHSGGISLEIEATALAALALMKDAAYWSAADKAAEYLVAHRQGGGGFGSTQATVLALKALIAHAKMSRRVVAGGELTLKLEGDPILRRKIEANETNAVLLDDFGAKLRPGKNQVTLTVGDGNRMPYVLTVSFRSPTGPSDPKCPVRLTTRLAANAVKVGETVRLDAELANLSEQTAPTPIAIVGLPAGLEPRTSQLDDLKKAGTIDYYELRPRQIVFYWRKLDARQNAALRLDLIATVPGQFTSPASCGYLYYTAEQRHWAAPVKIKISE